MTEPTNPAALSGRKILDAVKAAKIDYVLSVPDITTSDGLLWPLAKGEGPKLIRVCKEDEAIGIAAGLWACNKRAVILIQNTGFLYAMNAIRAVAMEYHQPICLLIGLLMKESDRPIRESKHYGVRIVPPILEAIDMPHHEIDIDADVPRITAGLNTAFETSQPVAFLLVRSPSP